MHDGTFTKKQVTLILLFRAFRPYCPNPKVQICIYWFWIYLHQQAMSLFHSVDDLWKSESQSIIHHRFVGDTLDTFLKSKLKGFLNRCSRFLWSPVDDLVMSLNPWLPNKEFQFLFEQSDNNKPCRYYSWTTGCSRCWYSDRNTANTYG